MSGECLNMSHMMQRLLMVRLGSEENDRCLDVVKSFGSFSDERCNMLIICEAQDCVSKANRLFQKYWNLNLIWIMPPFTIYLHCLWSGKPGFDLEHKVSTVVIREPTQEAELFCLF